MNLNHSFIIADNNPIDKFLHAKIVSELGHQVIATVADGEELIKLCREHYFDMILCDTIMPKLNGLEAALKIKTEFPLVKIIGVSAYANVAFPTVIKHNCFDAYLLKGFSALKLKKVIDCLQENALFIDPLLNTELQKQIRTLKCKCTKLQEQSELLELSKLADLTKLDDGIKIEYNGSVIKISEKNIQLVSAIYHSLNREKIAEILIVSPNTVDQNIKRLKQKFEVQNKMELVKLFLEWGLINENNY